MKDRSRPTGLLFVSPAALFFAVVMLLPLLAVAILSFTEWTGFSLSSSWRLPIGSKVLIYFELPRAVAVDTEAELVRVGGAGDELGFRFLGLPFDVALALERFVEQTLNDAPERASSPDPSVWC